MIRINTTSPFVVRNILGNSGGVSMVRIINTINKCYFQRQAQAAWSTFTMDHCDNGHICHILLLHVLGPGLVLFPKCLKRSTTQKLSLGSITSRKAKIIMIGSMMKPDLLALKSSFLKVQ